MSFVISMYCKEIAYTAFIMMFLYYVCFVSRDWRRWPSGLRLVLPYIALAVANMYMTHFVGHVYLAQPFGIDLTTEEKISATTTHEHPSQYLLTQVVVVIKYIKLLMLPLPGMLNVDYDVTLVNDIWEFSTAISTIIVTGLLCAALILLLLNRSRYLAFFILWFLVIPLPNVSFFPGGVNELMVCYRLYLFSIAFYALLVAGVYKLFCYLRKKEGIEPRRLYLAEMMILTCIVLFYSVCAYEHNKVWKTEISLWEDAVKKSPNKTRPHYNLGKAYERSGTLDRAKTEYTRCINMFESALRSRHGVGTGSCYFAGRSLAAIYSNEGQHAEAIDLYSQCLKMWSWDAEGHNNLGLAYYRAGHLEEAEREFRLAIEFNPGLSVAYENLGALYEVKGELNAALATFTEAVTTDPQNGKAHVRLGQLWWNFKNRPDMALMHLDDALKSDLDEEVSKRVLAAIDAIKTQASHLLRPAIGKAP